MAYRILSVTPDSVTFEVDAQKHRDGQFTIHKEVREILGLKSKSLVSLIIETPYGKYEGVKTLKSGPEIYGRDLPQYVKAGQRIKVTASRPPE